jgi:ribA/ribD-fused uncharacterized protein
MRITNKYVFFHGGFLSQWHRAPMEIDGVKYSSCEQYMMYQKGLLFLDYEVSDLILQTSDSKRQKQLGRLVNNFNKETWDKANFQIVYRGNLEKFTQNESLRKQLLSFENKILVEASPYDKIWGIGIGEESDIIYDPIMWRGQNLLGWALTLVKHELLNQK